MIILSAPRDWSTWNEGFPRLELSSAYVRNSPNVSNFFIRSLRIQFYVTHANIRVDQTSRLHSSTHRDVNSSCLHPIVGLAGLRSHIKNAVLTIRVVPEWAIYAVRVCMWHLKAGESGCGLTAQIISHKNIMRDWGGTLVLARKYGDAVYIGLCRWFQRHLKGAKTLRLSQYPPLGDWRHPTRADDQDLQTI